MHFTASDGSGSVGIWDHYDVDDEIEVSGQTSASVSGGLSMDDSREISGPGNLFVIQGYAGSGGYTGANYIYARDASQTLVLGSAHLTPGTLSVAQGVSIDDADVSAVVSTGDLGRMSAMQHAFVFNGSLDSVQTIGIDGSITTSQDTQMVGFLPTAFGTAGYIDTNFGPTNLKIEGEGAAVGVSSYDSKDGISEVDCSLSTGAGNSAWSYGEIRSATSDKGGVGAVAGAGNIDLVADWNNNIYINGEAEAAGIGVAAIGKNNAISGTLAASTGDDGTSVYGSNIEATNKDGIAVAAAAAGGLGVGLDLQNGVAGGGAEAAAIGVTSVSENKNAISAGTLAAGTGPLGTGVYGEDIEASNRDGIVVAAAAAGGLGAVIDPQSGIIGGGAEAGAIGVAAAGGTRNNISAGTLAARTGLFGTDVYGEDIEATNKDGIVVAAAAVGGLGAGADLQNATIGGGAEGAVVGVVAEGENNNISAGTLAAGVGVSGTGSYGKDIEATSRDGFVVAAAAAGVLGAGADLKNATVGGGAEAALVGVAAVGDKKNEISAGTLAAGAGVDGTGSYGKDIEASNKDGIVVAAAAAGVLGAGADLKNGIQNATIGGGVEGAVAGVVADGKNNAISAGTLATGAGFAGASAYGEDIEASNRNGFVVAAAAVGGLDAGAQLRNGTQNATIGGSAEAALVGVAAVGNKNNEISAGTLAAGTSVDGAGSYGEDIEATSENGFAVAAAAVGGLEAGADLKDGIENATIRGSAGDAVVGVVADGKNSNISAGTLAVGTGFLGTSAYGEDIEATSEDGFVVAAAGVGGLNAWTKLVNGTQNATISGSAKAALVGVAAVGDENNSISARTLAADTGSAGTGAYGDHIEATSEDGFAVAAAAAGSLGAGADLQNATGSGGAVGAVVGVVADGENNSIRAGALAAGTGPAGAEAYGDRIEAHNEDGFVVAAAAAGGLGVGEVTIVNGLENATISGVDAEGALVGVAAVGDERNAIRAGTLAAGTGVYGTGSYGRDLNAYSEDGFAVAAAAAVGLGGDADLQNATGSGGVVSAVVGVVADGEDNWVHAGTLEAETGFAGTGAYGDRIEAHNENGSVVAAAAASSLGAAGVTIENSLENATFNGVDAEGAIVGVAAVGDKNNSIRAKTLAAGTGIAGTGAYGDRIEAHNEEGFVVAVAASGGLGGNVTLQNHLENATISGGAEGAIFGAGAYGIGNNLSVGGVWTATGNSSEVVAVDVEASSLTGYAGVGAAAGNVDLLIEMANNNVNITGEGSAAGAGASGLASYAGADCLVAKSEGNITFAGGRNLTASVNGGMAGAGAISGVYDSNKGGWAWASVEGDITGIGNISGNFWADTITNATAKANNVSADGTLVHLESHAKNGTSSSNVNTTIFNGRFDGEMEATSINNSYTMASQNGSISSLGGAVVIATAKNLTFARTTTFISVGPFYCNTEANAWTNDTYVYTTVQTTPV